MPRFVPPPSTHQFLATPLINAEDTRVVYTRVLHHVPSYDRIEVRRLLLLFGLYMM